jgi:hypothetical protein
MKHKTEYIAEDLFKELNTNLKKNDSSIEVVIEGIGVHWNCNLILDSRKCVIHCFDYSYYKNFDAQYLISFMENEEDIAWGRTENRDDVIKSCSDWIFNKSLDQIYKSFKFVDELKRLIIDIEFELLKNQPKLEVVKKISTYDNDLADYTMQHGDRSCDLCGYGINEPITFRFLWDDCELFEVRQDNLSRMALSIKKWLIDNVLPSELEQQMPEIIVGDVAKYYEIGEGIKGEFIESWNNIEKFYQRINEPFVPKVLKLIEELRNKGFDKTLRVGQSLYYMMLSRSRRHGLTYEHKFLSFSFYEEKLRVTNELNMEFVFDSIRLNDELEQLIRELEKIEID